MATESLTLIVATGILFGLVGLVAASALGVAVWKQRADRRNATVHERIRSELFERLGRDEPEWRSYLSERSQREREALAAIVEQFLRTVRGDQRDNFLEIAQALSMGKRADETLDSREIVPRLRALARLSVLDYPISHQRLVDTCLDEYRTREAAARLLSERPSLVPSANHVGTQWLVWHGERPMTIRGLDTLYALNEGDPEPLLMNAARNAEEWSTPVLVQVCSVLAECRMNVTTERIEWVFELFEADDPRIRMAAIRVFLASGWRPEFRGRIPFRTLIMDDDPRVRRETYRVLAIWGDENARNVLEVAMFDETDERAQLLAVRALASLRPDIDPEETPPSWPRETWAWVLAEMRAMGRSTVSPEVLSI